MRLDRRALYRTLFKKDSQGQEICQVDGLEVLITKRYESFAALSIDEYVTTLGLIDLCYQGEHYGCGIPLMITMSPTIIEDVTIGDEAFYKLIFNKDDIFMLTSSLVQRTDLVFALFKLFGFFGIRYPFMTPENIATTTFRNFYLTGFNMQYSDSAVWSAFYSELERQSLDKVGSLYRHGPKGKSHSLGMKHVASTATKLTTKISGSYLSSTLDKALVTTHDQNSEIEDLLRR